MRFLVRSKPKFQMPPEMAPQFMDAILAWASKYRASGKMVDVWSEAGRPHGGGVFDVESLEELDAIMVEFPIGAFSEIEVVPLTDLDEALQRSKRMLEAMSGR